MKSEESRMPQWENKYGPASILAIAQLAVLIIGGVYTYAKLESTASSAKDAADSLRIAVSRQRDRSDVISERLIKVETNLATVGDTLKAIASRLNQVASPTQQP